MSSETQTESMISEWEYFHGKLDLFQRVLFVEHVAFEELRRYPINEIIKAFHITPKLSEALFLLTNHKDLNDYSPLDPDDLEIDEPDVDDILAHDKPVETIQLWI